MRSQLWQTLCSLVKDLEAEAPNWDVLKFHRSPEIINIWIIKPLNFFFWWGEICIQYIIINYMTVNRSAELCLKEEAALTRGRKDKSRTSIPGQRSGTC